MPIDPKDYIPSSDSESYKKFPFFWITRINGKYINLIEKSIKQIDLDNTKRKILLTIDALDEPNITEIANFAYAKLTTVTKAIYRMQEQGLVQCYPSTKDERTTMVTLTEQGLSVIDKLHQINAITLSGVIAQFEEQEMQQLNQLLQKLYHSIPN
jgi:DNA-binding MarR family transcriptional regulator